jgi:hypothetical protein
MGLSGHPFDAALPALVERLRQPAFAETDVISWGCPVPAFGDLAHAKVATLGLNPSNREFLDAEGNELQGEYRRFHTLDSLGLTHWAEATTEHLRLISACCRSYFSRNPYDRWFRELDHVLSGASVSYYEDQSQAQACHLDLIPYATYSKWMELSHLQRVSLLELASDTLGLLLRDSDVQVLILNGSGVVGHIESLASVTLAKSHMAEWTLARKNGSNVTGFSYVGSVQRLAGVDLQREVAVLGFNHNIQSSFGVTKQVRAAIRDWISKALECLLP